MKRVSAITRSLHAIKVGPCQHRGAEGLQRSNRAQHDSGTHALFKWKGRSCLDIDAGSCWLDHGDVLIMDGQCPDAFAHCTDSGLEQEGINITLRWIKRHVASRPFSRTGVMCCLSTCASNLDGGL